MMANKKLTIKRFNEMLIDIESDLRRLSFNLRFIASFDNNYQNIFNLIDASIEENRSKINYKNWIIYAFMHVQCSALRRIIQGRKNDITIKNILKKILKYTEFINEDWYTNTTENNGLLSPYSSDKYRNLVKDNIEETTKEKIKKLKDVFSKLKQYSNRFVAHIGFDDPYDKYPTYRDIFDCAYTCSETLDWCCELLKLEDIRHDGKVRYAFFESEPALEWDNFYHPRMYYKDQG